MENWSKMVKSKSQKRSFNLWLFHKNLTSSLSWLSLLCLWGCLGLSSKILRKWISSFNWTSFHVWIFGQTLYFSISCFQYRIFELVTFITHYEHDRQSQSSRYQQTNLNADSEQLAWFLIITCQGPFANPKLQSFFVWDPSSHPKVDRLSFYLQKWLSCLQLLQKGILLQCDRL